MPRCLASANRAKMTGWPSIRNSPSSGGYAPPRTCYRYARAGGPVKTEDDPLDPAQPASARETNAAMRHLDEAVTAAGGIALRYGGCYGAASDGLPGPIRKRQFPVVGDGAGVSSFIHLDDAAAATVLALEHSGAGHLRRR